jgi:hypothetical protein
MLVLKRLELLQLFDDVEGLKSVDVTRKSGSESLTA